MATYTVTTVVEFVREIEADTIEEAKEIGYTYRDEDYTAVVSVDVEEVEEVEEDDEDTEMYLDDLSEDAEALASAGHGTDEDYY